MAKVDWITWKTDTKELINTHKVELNLSRKIAELNNITNNVYNNVKLEIDKGGLSEDALDISGESPNNIIGNELLKRIDNIKLLTDKLKRKINTQVFEQKNIEKEQLIAAVENKIKEQEKILENTISLKDKLTADNNLISISEVESVIDSTNEKLTMLRGRLEQAKTIDNDLNKESFEHGNCFDGYKEILDSLMFEIDGLKKDLKELEKSLNNTINDFSNIEANASFRKTDILTDVTKMPTVSNENIETQEKGSINTIPIGLGIAATGIAGSVGAVVVDSITPEEKSIPVYQDTEEKVNKADIQEKPDEFLAHENVFDDVSPYHASRNKEVIDKFYDED